MTSRLLLRFSNLTSWPLRVTVLLWLSLAMGCSGTDDSSAPRSRVYDRDGFSHGLVTYVRLLRTTSGARQPWTNTIRHLRGSSTMVSDYAIYARLNRGEGGFVVALRTLFGGFLGPWGWHELGNFFRLLAK